jgi:hypothetical protein
MPSFLTVFTKPYLQYSCKAFALYFTGGILSVVTNPAGALITSGILFTMIAQVIGTF